MVGGLPSYNLCAPRLVGIISPHSRGGIGGPRHRDGARFPLPPVRPAPSPHSACGPQRTRRRGRSRPGLGRPRRGRGPPPGAPSRGCPPGSGHAHSSAASPPLRPGRATKATREPACSHAHSARERRPRGRPDSCTTVRTRDTGTAPRRCPESRSGRTRARRKHPLPSPPALTVVRPGLRNGPPHSGHRPHRQDSPGHTANTGDPHNHGRVQDDHPRPAPARRPPRRSPHKQHHSGESPTRPAPDPSSQRRTCRTPRDAAGRATTTSHGPGRPLEPVPPKNRQGVAGPPPIGDTS